MIINNQLWKAGDHVGSSGPELCGPPGYQTGVVWCHPGTAAALGHRLADDYAGREVIANPHLTDEWAQTIIESPAVIDAVRTLIGPDVAVENTFLMIKWPSTDFVVPPHQDGTNERMELDPARSVAAWLAITPATRTNGCLEVAVGSHRSGYRSYHRDAQHPADTGQPLTTPTAGEMFRPLPLRSGYACLMDVRLLHRSGRNRSERPRIGLNVRYIAPRAFTRGGPEHRPHVLTGDRW